MFRLTLGEGYGRLSGEHGLTIGNLVQATVVVADGSILTANETENGDLFWAIRGGGCNFGVVTEFVFKLYEQRRTIYAGVLIYPPSLVNTLIQALNNWWQKGPSKKEGITLVLTCDSPPECYPCAIIMLFYNGSEQGGRTVFKAFLDLSKSPRAGSQRSVLAKPDPEPLDQTSEMPYENLNTLMNPNVYHDQSIYLKGVKFSMIQPDEACAILGKVAEVTADGSFRMISAFGFFPHERISSVPKDATAMHKRAFQKNVLTTCLGMQTRQRI
ncbi:uncharacterized protein FOMMEDRAFT_169418 [Fomitiporia mediterranea MF3/22]|uniref:uncharacterized protein n=1 Tax=Fomitiporia mediterranea (strain MF3/22) TaxID=694068 RepID=UPI00044088ED|nr:uncharacterized protein FOMMEDRAFT_169418 [Fomitiporia mediterranea MF3/22]EJD01263.1 hypothetical protein FOMMEDRAFT_169418 [Fomitiporia mediterranea MF3/22]